MRWAVTLLVIAGCYDPDLEPGLPCTQDTHQCPGDLQCDPHTDLCVTEIEPPCSLFGAWSNPKPLSQTGGREGPALSPDGKLLVFMGYVGTTDLFIATWDAVAQDIDAPTPIDAVNEVDSGEGDAAWGADGTELYFQRDGVNYVSAVSAGPTFGDPVEAASLAGLDGVTNRVRFTWDGLEVYYWDDFKKLHHARRTSPTAQWEDDSSILVLLDDPDKDEREPTIDADGLHIVYSVDDFELREASRVNRSDPFGTPQTIELGDASHLEPELSRDGTMLFFVINGDQIYVMTRTCEAH
jgi:hypothetical protein